MVTIPIGDWFRLPFMGKDVFIRLAKDAQLRYDSKRGFLVIPATDLTAVSTILQSALSDDVNFVLKCFTCGSPAPCNLCVYDEKCDKRAVSSACICNNCEGKEEAYALYSLKFAKESESH